MHLESINNVSQVAYSVGVQSASRGCQRRSDVEDAKFFVFRARSACMTPLWHQRVSTHQYMRMECAGICYWEPSVSLCVGTNDSEEGKEWAKFQVASAICIANSARDGSGCTGAFDYASCMLALHARLQQLRTGVCPAWPLEKSPAAHASPILRHRWRNT